MWRSKKGGSWNCETVVLCIELLMCYKYANYLQLASKATKRSISNATKANINKKLIRMLLKWSANKKDVMYGLMLSQ